MCIWASIIAGSAAMDHKHFEEKFRDALEKYMRPQASDKKKIPNNQKEEEYQGLFKDKKNKGSGKSFTSFFERNVHHRLAYGKYGKNVELVCDAMDCGGKYVHACFSNTPVTGLFMKQVF